MAQAGLAVEGRRAPERSRCAGTGVKDHREAGHFGVPVRREVARWWRRRRKPRGRRSSCSLRSGGVCGLDAVDLRPESLDLLTRATRKVVALAGMRSARLELGPPVAAVEMKQFYRT